MRETIQEFASVIEEPYVWLAKAKKTTDRKVIGCFPMYVPHELVHAAGMWPIDLVGGNGEMTAAAQYLQNIVCYPMRSALELLLTGQLSALDGAVFATICTAGASGGEMWRNLNLLPYYHQLVVPRKAGGEGTLQYFTSQIGRFKSSLEAFGGRAISGEALADSIKLYNRSRSLLQRLYEVNRRNPEALPPQDLAVVRGAASLMPREEYVKLLSKLVEEVEAAPTSPRTERVPMVLVGSICDLPQIEILSVIHAAGGAIVEDDSPLGRRMLLPVTENGDQMVALAQRYVDTPPCPTKCDATLDANFAYLVELTKSAGAQGLVFLRPLYCDVLGLDYALLSGRLTQAGIANLSLDLNGREGASGQVQTRMQAFVEMLRR